MTQLASSTFLLKKGHTGPYDKIFWHFVQSKLKYFSKQDSINSLGRKASQQSSVCQEAPNTQPGHPLSLCGSVQGQAGRGFEQPHLVEGIPAHGRGAELDDL